MKFWESSGVSPAALGKTQALFSRLGSAVRLPSVRRLLLGKQIEQDVDALARYDGRAGRYPKSWADLGPRYNQ